MLAIRLQRTGRKGHAQYRMVVQDSRLTPTSGRVVARLGHYNPHTKDLVIKKDQAEFYLKNGAQPSDRVISLLKKEGVAMPAWVHEPTEQSRVTRNPEKLRKNQPKEETPQEAPQGEAPAEAEAEASAEKPAEEPAEQPAEDVKE